MQREMRRKDRLVENKAELIEIIEKCEICRIAMVDEDGAPYIVPMNFGYSWEEDNLILYFHGAKVGRKVDILEKNKRVCIEMDCEHELVINEDSAKSTYKYASIIGDATVSFVEELAEKEIGLQKLMEHLTKRKGFSFTEAQLNGVFVFTATVTELKGKRH